MKILFNDFKKEYIYLENNIDKTVKKVFKSGSYILGEKVKSFEKKFAEYLGVKYCVGVANGFEALQIALMVLGIKQGDEVITTPLTAAATSLAIKHVGAQPVFVDLDKYYHLDSKKIEGKISSKTKAILPVHLYGQSVQIDEIKRIAKKYNLYLIEDAAQAHGVEYKEKKVGTFGDIGCFSFYPTKNLGCYGDGGAIVTKSKNIYEKCQMLRNYGQKNRYQSELLGLNSRLDEIQAATLIIKLKYLDTFNQKRNDIANIYFKYLENLKEIKLPLKREKSNHIYHLFVIEVKKREKLINFLKKSNIPALVHYPIPIHKQKSFFEFRKLKLPIVETKTKKILSLPIHPFFNKKEAKHISKKIKQFYER